MDERPRPDIEHTREALRQHDERAEEPASEESEVDEEKSSSDDSDDE